MIEGWEETLPVKQTWPCAHCGRTMGDMEGGFASYNGFMLCHPNSEDRPDCYKLVSLEHHHPHCDQEGCWNGSHGEGDPV